MSQAAVARFTCAGCCKSYAWKTELAGRRVKCKCGQVMTVPQAPPQQPPPSQEDIYGFAPADEDAVKAAFAAARKSAAHSEMAPPQPSKPRSPVSPALAYQRGPTQREIDRSSAATLMDMKRDVYAPLGFLIAGMILYVGYYAWRYQLGGSGIAVTSFGLGVMAALKTILLIGFAFAVAGPLGVGFGGIWTAVLKFAAIAVFCDGLTTWVDAGVAKIAGGGHSGGVFGWSMISFPIALGVYWMLLTYLFSMDPGDSWMVVLILSVFDYIVRTVLILLLLKLILSWGGISPSAVPIPTFGGGGGGSAVAANPIVEHIEELKEFNLLKEAREYIAGGRQEALTKPVNSWYAAGAKNVWFEVSRDINGKTSPEGLVIEMPTDKQKRAQIYQILIAYYDEYNTPYDPSQVADKGDPYLMVGLP